MRIFSHKNRPAHLGPYPLERLPRSDRPAEFQGQRNEEALTIEDESNPNAIGNAMREYINIMDRMREGPVAAATAPIPDDPVERANHLKAACYFLDASMAGTCRIPKSAILANPVVNHSLTEAMKRDYGVGSAQNAMSEISVREGREAWAWAQEALNKPFEHTHAIVILLGYDREPDPEEPGAEWIVGTQPQRAALRTAEVAAVIANYLRFLGYEARTHTATASDLNFDSVLLACGLGEAVGSNGSTRVTVPYLGIRYGVAVVSTNLEIEADSPLAPGAVKKSTDFRWWLGVGGTRPGFSDGPFKDRHFHLGPYPMEKLRRVKEPTTVVDTENVPRVPKRNDFFLRAAMGDLGAKAARELKDFRMITKSPFGHATIPVLGGMVPLQYGNEAGTVAPGTDDPKTNTDRIKAALYYLGADMVGICEIPRYAWYSHDLDGSEIKPYHRYGIAVLIDQGYETMEGASGDDWICGAQSMRAYMRAQTLGGVVGAHIRNLGYPARGHSVMDQDVLHMPLILQSGLGELGRIGELVMNPYVGPRFKSGFITTDMPLEPDLPIDFGLQDFCTKCSKCARECPCTAIPFGDKIMFNNYEIWKPDVEKCARYRITQPGGSMCGRCMKTCPFNLEGVLKERPFLWAAMHLPFTRKWIAALDDKVGNGRINPLKKWWWDLDTDEDGAIIQAKRVNRRQLDPESKRPANHKLACYPVAVSVPPVTDEPVSPNRKEGMEFYRTAESPVSYRAKMAHGKQRKPDTPRWQSVRVPEAR